AGYVRRSSRDEPPVQGHGGRGGPRERRPRTRSGFMSGRWRAHHAVNTRQEHNDATRRQALPDRIAPPSTISASSDALRTGGERHAQGTDGTDASTPGPAAQAPGGRRGHLLTRGTAWQLGSDVQAATLRTPAAVMTTLARLPEAGPIPVPRGGPHSREAVAHLLSRVMAWRLGIDVVAATLGTLAAFVLRLERLPEAGPFLVALGVSLALKAVAYLAFDLHRRSWSNVSFRDLGALALLGGFVVVVGTSLLMVGGVAAGIPRSVAALDGAVTAMLKIGRASW